MTLNPNHIHYKLFLSDVNEVVSFLVQTLRVNVTAQLLIEIEKAIILKYQPDYVFT